MNASKKLLSLFTVGAIMLACTACSSGSSGSSTPSNPSSTGGPSSASSPSSTGSTSTADNTGKSYTFGYNNFGQGAYPLDLNESVTKYALQSMGMKMTSVNNQFTVDKLMTDAKTQISQGVDGMVFWSAASTLFQPFSQMCQNTKTPFALGDKYPYDTKIQAMLRNNKYFAGAISTDDAVSGGNMAKIALAEGHKKALIVAAAVGDINHDLRISGFTKAFEAGGGKVLGVAHCADPSEAVQKSNDLITAHPDADCLYGSGGDYSQGILSCLQSSGRAGKLAIYGTDIDPNVIKAIKNGTISAANGAAGPYCAGIAAALLVNYLDGHPILDENNQAPCSNGIMTVTVTSKNVDDYNKYWIEKQIFTPDQYKSLLYRYNPKVTWKDYQTLISNYTFDNMVATAKARG